MTPPTRVPLMAFRRPIKASSTKLCTAMSRCIEMGLVCRFLLMSVTGEPTQTRSLGGAIINTPAFRRNLGNWSYIKGFQRRFAFHGHM